MSLLEVLFSIGIVAVGMLGVLILLPVGGSRVTRGSVADHADRVGRSAIREFHVQHMGQPNRQYAPTLNPALSGQLATINGNAFCIDPLFIAQHLNTTNNSVSQEVGCFPCVVPAAVMDTRMRRITLCTLPGSNAPLLALQAQQLFLNKDDLLFDLPADRTLAPTQQFGAGNTQRQFEGRFSWLATIAPKETVPNGVWVLSIVVFHRRDLAMTLPSATPSGDEPENERLVDVVFAEAGTTYGTGLGGGDMLLRTRTVQNPNPQRPRVDLALREGEWVMLIGTKAYQSGGQTQHLRRFKWYRVQSLEPDIQQSGNFYERHVTLFGQDWDTTLTTQAVLINGVVAVYEKIIRSESSSLWTEQ